MPISPVPTYRAVIMPIRDSGECASLLQEWLHSRGAKVTSLTSTEGVQDIETVQDIAPDLILTLGGTGFRPGDNTPERTAARVDRLLPGIMHTIMTAWLQTDPRAALERGVAGLIGHALVINLPNVPDRVRTAITALDPIIDHAINQLHDVRDHAPRDST